MNPVLANSTETFATIRLVIEVMTAVGAVGTIIWKLTKLGAHLVQRLDHLDSCIDDVKVKVENIGTEQGRLREADDRMIKELFFLKGHLGIPMSEPIEELPRRHT